ncbi:hypothetical protein ASPTUDRAFT_334328 [Aspergillus tubingensis CBS 134.48]|uniref:Uncharacterized protein n=1 Tax=Aspergillus tubingensis (strain CBS 134.48) TaxID=767770 RepID=A0A1L9NK51_ASPTC|nr:hypothetical protein ASPTUDRAFT_334328 [Aspergillus tubingensis CBS 134.48]
MLYISWGIADLTFKTLDLFVNPVHLEIGSIHSIVLVICCLRSWSVTHMTEKEVTRKCEIPRSSM